MDHLLYKLFPKETYIALEKIVTQDNIEPEEIRIRLGQAPVIRCMGKEYLCTELNSTEKDISYILMNATNGAFHAAIDSIQNGFLSLPNGSRLGICGEGAVIDHKIHNMRHVLSLCLRIAHEHHGCAEKLFDSYYCNGFQNTIIIAPPGIGKTTLLRECIRKLSNNGYYVGVADERGEISGMHHGKLSFDLGKRTDVICGIDKPRAASMLLRTMAPDIIAMDEITSLRDLPAIIEAIGCGVSLLATIHGKDIADLYKPLTKEIIETKAFKLAIVIQIQNNERFYKVEQLYD